MGTNQRKHKKNLRQLFYWAVTGLIFLGIIFYARNLEQHSTHFFVKFQNPDKKMSREFKLAIARTESDRAKGLMFVKEMAEEEGMIFVYPVEAVNTFWMKNTYIPLDVVFADKNWRVVGVLNDVPIMNLEPRSVGKPSTYVIELNAGVAKKQGIQEGSLIVFDGAVPQAK